MTKLKVPAVRVARIRWSRTSGLWQKPWLHMRAESIQLLQRKVCWTPSACRSMSQHVTTCHSSELWGYLKDWKPVETVPFLLISRDCSCWSGVDLLIHLQSLDLFRSQDQERPRSADVRAVAEALAQHGEHLTDAAAQLLSSLGTQETLMKTEHWASLSYMFVDKNVFELPTSSDCRCFLNRVFSYDIFLKAPVTQYDAVAVALATHVADVANEALIFTIPPGFHQACHARISWS